MFYSIFIVVFSMFTLPLTTPDSTLTLKSPAFAGGKVIPVQYTCDGQNISPEIRWFHVPEGTKSFTLIMDDPDAGSIPWVHWVVFNIPATRVGLPKGIAGGNRLKSGGEQGTNSFKKAGYGGPCPPEGPPHQYVMKLYALNVTLNLKADADKAHVLKAMQGHIIEKAELKALYKRR